MSPSASVAPSLARTVSHREGGGTGALPWEILFLVAAVLVLAALTLAIAHVVRRETVLLSVITIVVGAVPVLAILGGLIFALPIFQ